MVYVILFVFFVGGGGGLGPGGSRGRCVRFGLERCSKLPVVRNTLYRVIDGDGNVGVSSSNAGFILSEDGVISVSVRGSVGFAGRTISDIKNTVTNTVVFNIINTTINKQAGAGHMGSMGGCIMVACGGSRGVGCVTFSCPCAGKGRGPGILTLLETCGSGRIPTSGRAVRV